MRKPILSTMIAIGLIFGAGSAFAGSYGEPEQPEEMPAPPPAPAEVVPEPEPDYAAPGAYVGIGGLYAIELFAQGDGRTNAGGDASNSSGFHIEAGYRIIPNLAVEARFARYTEFDTDPGHVEAWSGTANVKGFLLTGRCQPYLLMGLGYIDSNTSRGNPPAAVNAGDGFIMRFGGGMDGYITEHISIGPEIAYVLPFGDASNLDMIEIGAGIKYRF